MKKIVSSILTLSLFTSIAFACPGMKSGSCKHHKNTNGGGCGHHAQKQKLDNNGQKLPSNACFFYAAQETQEENKNIKNK